MSDTLEMKLLRNAQESETGTTLVLDVQQPWAEAAERLERAGLAEIIWEDGEHPRQGVLALTEAGAAVELPPEP